MNPVLLRKLLAEFLVEDLSFGDTSSRYFASQTIEGHFVAKADGVVAGQQIAQEVYDLLGTATYTAVVPEGTRVMAGTVIGAVRGDAATILGGERIILNLMQRMSGIATLTATAVRALNDEHIRIVDTRKTLPGLRMFDKYAVTVGGGCNHRLDLAGGVMLKDNHIAAAGGIAQAVARVKQHMGPMTLIEVEVETETELRAAVAAGADVIMFDNQTPATVAKWRAIVPTEIRTEASGGIDINTLPSYAGCGVDFISLGYLTNAVVPVDISFLLLNAVKR